MTFRLMTTAALAALLAAQTVQAQGVDMPALEAAAVKEGMLTTIALPHDWCNYGANIEGFKAKYPGIKINELNPDGSSADELEAIRANKGNTGPQAPDVIDVGLAFGPQAKTEGLTQPYKVATWDSIPAEIKDADGHWFGDYYGVMAFGVNTDIVKEVPKSWADLLKSDYKNAFALTGDPRASNQAILATLSAGMSRGGEPGEASGTKGLEYFAELNKAGNFVPVTAKAGTIAQGATPIVAAWDYNLLSWRDQLAGNPPMEVVIPSDGVLAGVYVQAISAHAPHPNAAKLWMEYLYSDEGQINWLKGYCHPARFNDLTAKGLVPQDILDKMPPADAYAKAVFPSLEAQEGNKKVVTENWDKVVGATVAE
ncbi:ABC transporter substrate-binding protein [Paracoccus suum]|uniref:ABC transporter substrate-binding protein n=1 Tax=Paracoccus suum TaxID=2259340 RepID=A0A344PKN1_9RHOB|nr:ABC transporter substrate-binding protein [Paracoccus suum]AXC49936.1 ABC transporter substrate-binding protein [Paracoccus suum]